MSIFDEPKIDCHAHVIDPKRFPYNPEVVYKPSGQEIGTAAQLQEVIKHYATRHTLLVQPNSGYGDDNRCLLNAIENHPKTFKGVAIVDMDVSVEALRTLKSKGIVGIAFNPTFYGIDYYQNSAALIQKLADLDMFVNLQYQEDQLQTFVPWIKDIPAKFLIDHCGLPSLEAGLDQVGFGTLLPLAETGRVYVKLSGYNKFSHTPYPFTDCHAYIRKIVNAFTLDRCLWASDWPYLRATERQDYGPLVKLVEVLFPDAKDRQKLFWETPKALFGFNG